jgi:transcriptional regulator of acetoin/glycerol metabolism
MEPEPRRDPATDLGQRTIDEMEKAMIENSLRLHAGNVSRVAEALGLSRSAMYRRLQRFGL